MERMSEAYKRIIREIKREMCEHGMTINMMAKEVGCKPSTYGQYLSLRMSMNATVMLKSVEYFGIDVTRIIFSKEYLKPQMPKEGEWIWENYYWHCSVCGENPTRGMGYVQGKSELFRVCPNCGARMKGEQE